MLALALVVCLANACRAPGAPPPALPPVRVAAASDLTPVFDELLPTFRTAAGRDVTVTYGSTGLLAKQVGQGAPFDVFAAADVSSVDALVSAGRCRANSRHLFARGRLVVWSSPTITAPTTLAELTAPRFRRIALANTEHAPYGIAAKAALEKAGLFSALEARLVYGDNVSHALQLVRTGNADAAVVARSLVATASDGHALLLDESSHPPLHQAIAVCPPDAPNDEDRAGAAGRVVDALLQHAAVLEKYGFEVEPP